MIIKSELKCVAVLSVPWKPKHKDENDDHLVFVDEMMLFSKRLPFIVDEKLRVDIHNEPMVTVNGTTRRPRGITKNRFKTGRIQLYYLTFSTYIEADVDELAKTYQVEGITDEDRMKFASRSE